LNLKGKTNTTVLKKWVEKANTPGGPSPL